MVGESQETVGAGVGGASPASNKTPTLQEYGTNLTTMAAEVRAGAAVGLIGVLCCTLKRHMTLE